MQARWLSAPSSMKSLKVLIISEHGNMESCSLLKKIQSGKVHGREHPRTCYLVLHSSHECNIQTKDNLLHRRRNQFLQLSKSCMEIIADTKRLTSVPQWPNTFVNTATTHEKISTILLGHVCYYTCFKVLHLWSWCILTVLTLVTSIMICSHSFRLLTDFKTVAWARILCCV